MQRIVLTALLLSLCLGARAEDGFKVIVHSDNPTVSLTRLQVSQLFLKQVTRWPNGGDYVRPIDLGSNSPVREAFTHVVLQDDVANVRAYWNKRIFAGRDVPPPEVSSDAAVVTFVRANPSAIGYVSAAARLDGVRELQVEE
jgi:ABC-type phosphate transport system substrate-binding protein